MLTREQVETLHRRRAPTGSSLGNQVRVDLSKLWRIELTEAARK